MKECYKPITNQCCGAEPVGAGSLWSEPMRRHKHFFNTLKPIFIGKEAGAGEKKYLEPEYKSVLDHIYPSKLLLMSCLTQEQGFSFLLA